jgi:hypothetical protein
MSTAIIVSVIVITVVAGGVLSLLRSTRTGMPPRDVLDRATRRARELKARDEEADRR